MCFCMTPIVEEEVKASEPPPVYKPKAPPPKYYKNNLDESKIPPALKRAREIQAAARYPKEPGEKIHSVASSMAEPMSV